MYNKKKLMKNFLILNSKFIERKRIPNNKTINY